MLESVSEETLQDLLQHSRATSRMLESRGSLRGGKDDGRKSSASLAAASSGRQSSQTGFTPVFSEESSEHKILQRQPFLPKIDPHNSMLITPKVNLTAGQLNNERSPSASAISRSSTRSRSSVNIIRNSFCEEEDGGNGQSGDSDKSSPSPHPPLSGGRRV